MVHNVHVRRLTVPTGTAAVLIDSLASDGDRLWPVELWTPVRYDVEAYLPGRLLRCRFTASRGLNGFHEFEIRPRGGECELWHVLSGSLTGPALVTFPLFWRPAHDAVIEDAFDRAERSVSGTVRTPARWSPYVRMLRLFAARGAQLGTAARQPV